MEEAQNDEVTPSRPNLYVLGAVGAFWLAAGVLSGSAEFMSLRLESPSVTWLQAIAGPVVAGMIWIPLTVAIGMTSLRYPPITLEPRFKILRKQAVAHGFASLSVTFVLNAVFIAVARPTSLLAPGPYTEAVVREGLRFLHFNLGGYWAIALGVIAIQFIRRRPPALKGSRLAEAEQTLTVRSGTRNVVVRIDEISWIEGADDYVRLHVPGGNHLYSERLKRLEKRLDPSRFVRVHRSAIVNVTSVRSLRHVGHGDYEVLLDSGDTVRVSRTRRAHLTELLASREVPDLPEAQN